MALTIEEIAKNAAQRVDPKDVGMDPLTIMTIFSGVVLPVLHCLMGQDEPDPNEVQKSVAAMHERNPEGLRRRTATKIKRERWNKDKERIQRQAALKLADALIAETLSVSTYAAATFCAAHAPTSQDKTDEA